MQVRSEESRKRILSVAMECFTTRGYDATGIAELCARAGLSKGGFYHHFRSKEEVFLDLYRRWIDGIEDSIQAVAGSVESFPRKLELLATLLSEVLRESAGQMPMFLEFWRLANRREDIRDAFAEPFRRFRSLLSAMLGESGSTPPPGMPDSEAMAKIVIALGAGLVVQSALDPDDESWPDVAARTVRLLVRALSGGGAP